MSIIGQTKKEEFNPDEARRMAAKVAQKSNPLLSRRRAEKLVAKEEKKRNRGIKF